MQFTKNKRWVLIGWIMGLMGLGGLMPGQAEVVLDNSLRDLKEAKAQGLIDNANGVLNGPNYQIPAEAGVQWGSNLYYSFQSFNVDVGQKATFITPPITDNIISRVTGGSASKIAGTLTSTGADVNFWFFNPAGIVILNGATLDFSSVHLSTADYIQAQDQGRFEVPSSRQIVLSVEPPSAFGFVTTDTTASTGITVENASLSLDPTNPDAQLSLIASDITVKNSRLVAPTISLVSVQGEGGVTLDNQQWQINEGESGNLEIDTASKLQVNNLQTLPNRDLTDNIKPLDDSDILLPVPLPDQALTIPFTLPSITTLGSDSEVVETPCQISEVAQITFLSKSDPLTGNEDIFIVSQLGPDSSSASKCS